uniref:Protein kinase domain-containing protein n=1 Tax=Odontella aurita TaxID=265563 RepID=A0A7S4JLR6_9STRA|mmetsp:Transcript_48938/g.147425  ORF Transcript_48938/g.147425 Transcript_48938/m.147425 type:complete len:417 (+) Transcript_48938:222-1472(+)
MASNGATLKIGKFSEDYLLSRAAEIVGEKTKNSTVFDAEAEAALPKFKRSELTLGRVLGRGGFCTVSEIGKVTIPEVSGGAATAGANRPTAAEDNDDDDEEGCDGGVGIQGQILQDRNFIATKYLRKGKDARYAIKTLSDDVMRDPERFVAGIIDLAIEARFLAVIKHPNIIKMRATAESEPYKHGFFVVLDRLYDTLTMRFSTWKRNKKKMTGIGKIRDMKGQKKKDLFIERILVSYDLAAAVKHLHNMNILYRDLKPDNIGFDVRGDVKIFDFGLAKEVRPDDKMESGLYKLSGNTGSLRYMAPEVALSQPYNFTADVYSFAILFWQILTMDTPFSGYSVNMHQNHVIKQGYRPKIDQSWSKSISNLLSTGWSKSIRDRPCFETVCEVLRGEVTLLRGDFEAILDVSNRTAKSM